MARKRSRPPQLRIRLPEDLRKRLEREAAKTPGGLNDVIVQRLQRSVWQTDWETFLMTAANLGGPDESLADVKEAALHALRVTKEAFDRTHGAMSHEPKEDKDKP